jgi:hypothetical protein
MPDAKNGAPAAEGEDGPRESNGVDVVAAEISRDCRRTN